MSVRLIINVTQVYIPMYTLETLNLSKVCASKYATRRKGFLFICV